MTPAATKHLLRWEAGKPLDRLDAYRAAGGYKALRKALLWKPEQVREEVKKGCLRGRGGAGFSAAMKWGFVPPAAGPKYLVINADEGEPGTFKDRAILANDPFRVIEGAAIIAHAVGLQAGYIYFRGEFMEIARKFEKAIEEARKGGCLGRSVFGSQLSFDLFVHVGAGAYICGEESALLESLEGRPGRPRLKPPFPAVAGAFARPTVVNNVETVACVPLILDMGGEAFSALGVPGDGGVRLFGLSGHVKRPGLYECPVGKNLKELIFGEGGGTLDDRPLKGVIPGGSSTPILLPDEIDVPMTFDALAKAGSMLGTGCPTVIAHPTCMVQVALRVARFYAHESCGQCTPCREGCAWMADTLELIESGRGSESDIALLESLPDRIEGRTICALGDAAAMPVRALVRKFRSEFEEHVRLGRCPLGASSASTPRH
jgi:NADH-quinone oxidoreductase subunit F